MLDTFSELAPYGWDDEFAQQFQSFAGDGRVPGRVVRVDRGALLAATPTDVVLCRQIRRALLPGSAPGPPSTGDWVVVHPEPGFGMALDAVLPRRSVVRRSDAMAGAEQLLAANVDIVLVVHCVDRPLRLTRLERALVMAWDGGATPVVLVNKTDLQDSAEIVGAITASLTGVDVLPVSALSGDGLDSLTELLGCGATVALIGESGTGKSSLINALLGEERLTVGPTRRGDYKGRHTTTARELVPLAGGPILIDTPGLRTMGLWDDDGGMALTFADVEELFVECRFRDCTHRAEPGCAVLAALDDGSLDPQRWAGYVKLQRELDLMARRARYRERKVAARQAKRPYSRVVKHRPDW